METKESKGGIRVLCPAHLAESEARACSPHLKTGTACGRGKNTWPPAGDHLESWGCCWGVWSHHSEWIPRQERVHATEENACPQPKGVPPNPPTLI